MVNHKDSNSYSDSRFKHLIFDTAWIIPKEDAYRFYCRFRRGCMLLVKQQVRKCPASASSLTRDRFDSGLAQTLYLWILSTLRDYPRYDRNSPLAMSHVTVDCSAISKSDAVHEFGVRFCFFLSTSLNRVELDRHLFGVRCVHLACSYHSGHAREKEATLVSIPTHLRSEAEL